MDAVVDAIVSEDELALPVRQWKTFWKWLQDSGLLSPKQLDAVRKARHLARDRFLAARKRQAKAAKEQDLQSELAALRSEVAALRAENDQLKCALVDTELDGAADGLPPVPDTCDLLLDLDQLLA